MTDNAIGELKEKGRVYVSYPQALRLGVEEAITAWKAFCELPVEQKQKFHFSLRKEDLFTAETVIKSTADIQNRS